MRKQTIKIVIAGHVDHGKSTLIGRLLLDTNSLSRNKFSELKKISKELGNEIELAYLTDQLKEEREQNKTIDTTQVSFKTKSKNFIIIDTPGHLELLKNMITGATQAEAAILIVDISHGIMEQTKRHAYLLSLLGINNVIIVFNKMDLVNYESALFDKVKKELLIFLNNINIKPAFILPVSSREGDNISRKSHNMAWYNGPTLINALDLLRIEPKRTKKPLRFPIQDIYEINGEKIIAGRVESGIIKKHQAVLLLPYNNEAKIAAIKVFGKQRQTKAYAGENIGLVLDKNFAVKRGDIITGLQDPPKPTHRFKGNLFWLSQRPLETNKTMTFRCATQEACCFAERIEKRIDSSTLNIIEENAKELRINEAALVTFVINPPIVIEKFSFTEELGRFSIEDGCEPVGIGLYV